LRPLLAEKHESGDRTAIHFQSDFPDFPPRPSAIGKLHCLLTNGRDLQRREDFSGDHAEEGPGIDEEAEFALELSLMRMAQPPLDIKDPHRAVILLAGRSSL
jgi:hypothetical protein